METNESERKNLFEEAILGAANKLLEDPASATHECVTLTGQYTNKSEEHKIREALAHWSFVFPTSSFYQEVEKSLHKKGRDEAGSNSWWFDHHAFFEVRGAHVEKFKMRLPGLLDGLGKDNKYVRIMCMFMLLPEAVARRWLWHANVDFQSPESFLRRLTAEQDASLMTHYILSVKEEASPDKLPCFTDGPVNKTWRFLGLISDTEMRMTAKSALAYDFFGFNMGFQLYPNEEHDAKASLSVSKQFLGDAERGAFELNQEVGGTYWWLYRTLRSNCLYNSEGDVKLGDWICPGFWFTMAFWAFILFVSPLCLFASFGVLLATREISLFLLIPGLITPAVATLVWARKRFSEGVYDGKYWAYVGIALGIAVLSVVIFVVFRVLASYPTFWVTLVSLVFLLPYAVKKETLRVWQLPYLGKTLLVAVAATLVDDLYRLTNFWENCLHLTVSIFALAAEYRLVILGVVLYLASLSLFFWGALTLDTKSKRRVNDLANDLVWRPEHNKLEVHKNKNSYARFAGLVVTGAILLVILFSLLMCTMLFPVMGYAVLAMLLPFVLFVKPLCSLLLGKFDVKKQLIDRVLDDSINYSTRCVLKKRAHAAVYANRSFWIDSESLCFRNEEFGRLNDHLNASRRGLWATMFARHVSSKDEFERAMTFLELGVKQGAVECNPTKHLALLVLRGKSLPGIEPEIEKRRAYEEKVEYHVTRFFEWFAFALEVLGAVCGLFLVWMGKAFRFCIAPFVLIWKFIHDLYGLWKSFNEACPRSPGNHSVLS